MKKTLAPEKSKFVSPEVRELVAILNETIANGAASSDTVATYQNQIKRFLVWCQDVGCQPLQATQRNIEQYRRYLVNKGLKVATIALKLTIVKRLYDVAIKQGSIEHNPALGVKPPIARKLVGANENFLSQDEAKKLISYLPKNNSLKGLRDRLLVALMVICGARQIELHKLSIGDIVFKDKRVGLKLSAKRSERIIPLTQDLAELLDRYIEARKNAGHQLNKETPVFICLATNNYGKALSRRAMQRIATYYINLARTKEREYSTNLEKLNSEFNKRTVTTHGLRHTAAHLMTRAGTSLRVIQDYLGHSSPAITAIYAHIESIWQNNPATRMGLSLSGSS